jgi:exosome complex component RRP42
MNEDLKSHIISSLDKGIRLDGRKLDEYRKVKVESGVYKTAEGSARVKIGQTEVLAGVKLAVEEPYPDIPDQGTIMVNAELLPLSNPDFESGPPDIWSIEVARVVDRGIRESKAIDMKKLCIEKGKKCWMVGIDVVPVNDNGNLLDASALAAMAALRDAKFPTYKDETVDYKKMTNKKINLTKIPVAVTVLKIGNNFVVDPTYEEEKVLDARLTVATTDDGKLCALQKGGEKPLSTENIKKMVDIGIKKGKELRSYLK